MGSGANGPSSAPLLAVLVGLLLFASGCAGLRTGEFNSYVAGGYPPAAVSQVAEDLAATLAETYPPGHTEVFLKPAGGLADHLGPALESALRARGFRLTPTSGGKSLTVAYVLDRLEDGWYSRLSVSDGRILARDYRQIGPNLEPAAATRREPAEARHGQK